MAEVTEQSKQEELKEENMKEVTNHSDKDEQKINADGEWNLSFGLGLIAACIPIMTGMAVLLLSKSMLVFAATVAFCGIALAVFTIIRKWKDDMGMAFYVAYILAFAILAWGLYQGSLN